jgi:hypothetical protein
MPPAYNPVTRTTLLLNKGPLAQLLALELGDNGYPLNPGNWIELTPWDGVVLDYLPSVAANSIDGQWLVTWELNGGGFARILAGTPQSGAGPTCFYSLNPLNSGTLSSAGASGNVSIAAFQNCAWSATANQSWIHTSSSGTGSGSIAYTVDPNPGSARTGSITVGGQTFSISQGVFVPPRAALTSPAGGSTLPGASVTFQWSAGFGATQYYLFIGTSLGASNIASLDMGTQLSAVVAGLPTNSSTIYVRLYSYMAGAWQFNDYVFTAAAPQKAQLVSPTSGSTLTSSTATLQWSSGGNATQYWLSIGSTPGASDIVNRDLGTTLSTVVSGLPTNGQTLYVRLHTYIGAWYFNDYTLKALSPPPPQKAQLVSPAPGTTLPSSTATFQWGGGVGVTQYILFVGTSPGGSDIASLDMGTQLSAVVTGLPTNGATIYVRLNSYLGGWQFNDYTFTAAPAPQKAQLVTPAPSTTLTNSTVSFNWTGGVNATQYWLFIGSTPGASDILSRDLGLNLSTVVTGLPTDGRTLHVRLLSYIGGWYSNDYTFTAASLVLGESATHESGWRIDADQFHRDVPVERRRWRDPVHFVCGHVSWQF